MNMILCILSFVTGYFISYFISHRKVKSNNRRGILKRSYTSTTDTFDVQFEVEEIDSSETKSKLHVINCIPSMSDYTGVVYKEKLKSLVENFWIESTEVEWVITKSSARAKKIDDILSNI